MVEKTTKVPDAPMIYLPAAETCYHMTYWTALHYLPAIFDSRTFWFSLLNPCVAQITPIGRVIHIRSESHSDMHICAACVQMGCETLDYARQFVGIATGILVAPRSGQELIGPMSIRDKKALDRDRNQLLRRAEAIQRQLDEVTRAAREELLSIREQIRALDSIREIPHEDDERRSKILERKPIAVKKKVKTVLIVEKQSNYSQSLFRQTEFAGFKPVVAVTAEGGLRKASECHPDLILLDIEIPDMDGLRFVSEIRRALGADQIPIIAISAFPHLKPRCLELGCDDFLLKPVRMVDLIARIRKFLHSDPKVSVRTAKA